MSIDESIVLRKHVIAVLLPRPCCILDSLRPDIMFGRRKIMIMSDGSFLLKVIVQTMKL